MESSATSVGYHAAPEAELKKMTKATSGDNYYWLYDVNTDPMQYTDLADDYPEVVEEMMALLSVYIAEQVDYNIDSDKEDAASEVAAETGYWGPWLSEAQLKAGQHPKTVTQPQVANKGTIVKEY